MRAQRDESLAGVVEQLRRDVRQLQAITTNRVLPQGYIWRVTAGGDLEVVELATGNSAVIL